MFTFKRKVKRKRIILAALLLFSFVLGLMPSGFGNIYAEELNNAPIIETAATIEELPIEPILPPEVIAPAPAEIVIEPVEEPVEVPPEAIPPEEVPIDVAPLEEVKPEVIPLELPTENLEPQPSVETGKILPADPIEPVLAPQELGGIELLAIATPGTYTSDPNYTHVLLSGVSTNAHTLPYIMWVGTGGYFYFAVKSTHYLKYMYLGSTSAPNPLNTNDPRYAEPLDEYDPWVEITVDDDTFEPENLNGNTNDSHWTVFRYPTSLLAAGGTYNLFIKGIGGGHDVGAAYTVVPPKVKATVTKTWSGGPMNPVDIQLSRSVNGTVWSNVGSSVTLSPTPPNNTYTWPALDYTDLTGKIYTYDIQEADPGQGYNATLTSSNLEYDSATRTYTYTWALLNTYTATGSVVLKADKVLAGRMLKAGEFNFQLMQGETVLQTKPNALDGSITFDAIAYTQADVNKTFTYTIREVAPLTPETGMTYDPMVITVDVLVTDNGDGTLAATPDYSDDVYFNNAYIASGSIILEADKVLAGRDLKANEFSFQLKHMNNLLQTKTNLLDGSITFDAIQYTQADIGKTYTYTITEVKPVVPESGMTYDPMILTVSVLVEDAGNGVLKVTPTYPDDVIFNNSYLASGSIILEADKVLTGRTLTLGEFSFQLKLGDAVLQTKTNALDGSVTFDPISYTEADIGQTFTYTIKEVLPTVLEQGMFYDSMTLTVSVLVEDAGNGVLTATPNYDDDVIFNNTFKSGNLEVKKVDDAGNPILGNEATFELRQGITVIKEKTNLVTGIASFKNLKIGTYTLVETVAPTGFELNPTVYTVIVKLNESNEIEVIVKTGGVDGTIVSSDPLIVKDKKLGSIVIEKLDSVTNAPLSGAEFDLYREVSSGTEGAVAFTMLDNTTIYGIKINAASLVTGIDGKTSVVGNLIQGDYFIVETKAPVGYKLLLEPVRITLIHPTLNITQTIINVKAPELPQTGGVGTMVFSIAGIGLMIGALLAYKKYNSNERIK